jgi:hypothetical protein
LENRDAEITDILTLPSGDAYATVIFSPGSASSRIGRPTPNAPADKDALPAPAPAEAAMPERFGGRSSLIWLPAGGGFPRPWPRAPAWRSTACSSGATSS